MTTKQSSVEEEKEGAVVPFSSSASTSKNQLSVISTSQTSARSRTRSVGAEGRFQTDAGSCSGTLLQDPNRGPGTPDFTLGAFGKVRGTREGASNTPFTNRRVIELDVIEEGNRKRSNSDTLRAGTLVKSPLKTQLRSLLTSITGSHPDVTNAKVDEQQQPSTFPSQGKARTSIDVDRKEPLQLSTAQPRPKPLIMPAARLARPDGMYSLNADSPPLTPASDEAREIEDVNHYLSDLHPLPTDTRHPWSVASNSAEGRSVYSSQMASGPLQSSFDRSITPASANVTVSSVTSGRSSPVFSNFSVASSSSTYALSSRPSSSIAKHTLLPSHIASPSMSPSQHDPTSRWSAFRVTSRMPPLRPHLPALLFLMTIFVGSTMCILLALSTLPLTLPSHITDLTIAEIREMSLQLKAYSRSSSKAFAHTLAVLGVFFTWKQSFTIPGSLIMNVVFGAMYGTLMGTLYTSVLTSLGGVFCYLLVAPLGSLIRSMPGLNKGLEKMQKAMSDSNVQLNAAPSPLTSLRRKSRREVKKGKKILRSSGGNIWSYLLVLRVLPIVPYGLMNIACSVLRVPLLPYAVTLAVGSIPWNACTVQIGDLLVQVVRALDESSSTTAQTPLEAGGFFNAPSPGSSTGLLTHEIKGKAESGARAIAAKIWNKEMMIKLILMSIVSLAPMLLQRWLKKRNEAKMKLAEKEDGDGEEDDGLYVEDGEEEDDDEEVDGGEGEGKGKTMTSSQEVDQRRSWRSSWTGANKDSKRFSGAWMGRGHDEEMSDLEGRKYPSTKRAVAADRVD
ncbi:hypothetical protein CBS101457_003396 [Exobasidium rhododendri]|nr:hypothetical protein CBS101457_003396 [Exobasidium rhododendri]